MSYPYFKGPLKKQKLGAHIVHYCDSLEGIPCGAKVEHREQWTTVKEDLQRPVTCPDCRKWLRNQR